MTENLLLEQLNAVKKEMRLFPAQTEIEAGMYEARICMVELKIECERRRQALRVEYAMCRKRTVTKVENEKEIELTMTLFGWEKLQKISMDIIDERETKGIEFYTNQVNQLRV
jgi:hypothetical protein